MAKKLFILSFVLMFFMTGLCSAVLAGEARAASPQGIFGNLSGALAEVETVDGEDQPNVVAEVGAGIYKPRFLPDHPLYFIKNLGESIRLFFTFNKVSKAKYLLYLAEKRVADAKGLIEKGKSAKAEKSLTRYQEALNKVMEQVQKAEEKGQNVEEVVAKVSEATLRHQKALADVWEKVPEPAKEAIEKVIDVSRKGYERAIEAIKSPEKRQELIEKAQGVKGFLKAKIKGFQETLEEGLENFNETEGEVPNPNSGVKTLDTDKLEKEGEKILPTPEIID